jgi:hypothetical protein
VQGPEKNKELKANTFYILTTEKKQRSDLSVDFNNA